VRVLVTRPEPGAGRTAARLHAMGFEPVVLPLSETRPLSVPATAVPGDAAAVAVTSANAIRHASPALLERLVGLPCHAVGKRTGGAARAAGFTQVAEGPGDASGLAAGIAGKLAGEVLAYLCGRERFAGFEDRLAGAGVRVRPIETYETVAVDHSDEAVLSALSGRPADALTLYSAKAAEAARVLAERPALRALFGRMQVYALSERIAKAFDPDRPAGEIHVAPRPAEEALLALLASRR
jgi:uroporphyrinogen-III synthase